jgi:hypothetical protein
VHKIIDTPCSNSCWKQLSPARAVCIWIRLIYTQWERERGKGSHGDGAAGRSRHAVSHCPNRAEWRCWPILSKIQIDNGPLLTSLRLHWQPLKGTSSGCSALEASCASSSQRGVNERPIFLCVPSGGHTLLKFPCAPLSINSIECLGQRASAHSPWAPFKLNFHYITLDLNKT